MKEKKLVGIFTLFAVGLLACGASQAAVVLSDDFESYKAGSEPDLGSVFTRKNAGGSTTMDVVADDGTVFGAVENKYLAFVDSGADRGDCFWIRSTEKFTSSLVTLSFDYYQPEVSGQSGEISLGVGSGPMVATVAYNISFSDGKVEGKKIGLDAKHHIDIVMNNTDSTVEYNGVSLASNKMDIWVDGSRVVDRQIALAKGRGIELTGFKFSTFNPNVEALYIDNLEVRDEAYVAVP